MLRFAPVEGAAERVLPQPLVQRVLARIVLLLGVLADGQQRLRLSQSVLEQPHVLGGKPQLLFFVQGVLQALADELDAVLFALGELRRHGIATTTTVIASCTGMLVGDGNGGPACVSLIGKRIFIIILLILIAHQAARRLHLTLTTLLAKRSRAVPDLLLPIQHHSTGAGRRRPPRHTALASLEERLLGGSAVVIIIEKATRVIVLHK